MRTRNGRRAACVSAIGGTARAGRSGTMLTGPQGVDPAHAWVRSPRCWGNSVAERTSANFCSAGGNLRPSAKAGCRTGRNQRYLLPRSGRFFINDRKLGRERHNSILDNAARASASITPLRG